MARRPRIGEALVACAGDDAARQAAAIHALTADDFDLLAEAARFHRVTGHVYRALCAVGGAPSELLEQLEERYTAHVLQHFRGTADLAQVGGVLDGAGVRWLAVKGPVLAERVYRPPELRLYSDLDIVVAQPDFPDAVVALEREGATVLDRNWARLRREMPAQIRLAQPAGMTIDLHWHLLNERSVRRSFAVAMSPVFERSVQVPVGARLVPALDPVDELLHLCVHAALSGADRLIWLLDVDRCVAIDAPVWDDVVAGAERWRATRPVRLVLERARQALGTAVPDGVLSRLALGQMFPRIDRAVARRWPVVDGLAPHSLPAIAAESARDGAVETAVALARRLARPLPRYVRRRPPEDPLLLPRGTTQDRVDYLASVARTSSPQW